MNIRRNYDPEWRLIEEAVKVSNGTMTKDALYRSWVDGEVEVWCDGEDFTIFLEVVDNSLWVISCVGNSLDTWLDALSDWLVEHAKECRCSKVVLLGRLGWKRKLAPKKYKFKAVMLEREI